ncbi:hypothetical protein Pcinc_035329 [Petrolisthes cinctipes]|uniref:Pre-rRNA-processing protein TSR1 homolog n=1 Tax=Petrolisthes cinctipes TaxID=88211 RepID=A0AAE1BWX4_PETCI|nr:hypothetical protein Pcinc_035329 [Petrolisthes cinctipes]
MVLSGGHRASSLKQQNKKHNIIGHRSKGSIKNVNKGRVTVKTLSKKKKIDLSREQRKNQNRQARALKRESTLVKKRALGCVNKPPFLVCVVPLTPSVNPRTVLAALQNCDDNSTTTVSPQGITHINLPRFKQRFSFVIPPVNDLYAILDSVKVSDTVMFVWPAEEELSEVTETIISSILAQGLPTPIHIITGLDNVAQKRQQRARQSITQTIEALFPGPARLHTTTQPHEALCVLRHIGQQKQRPIYYRDHRPHIMAENVQFIEQEEEGSRGMLVVEGFVRGRDLSVNSLVHIPGWGAYQLRSIDCHHQRQHTLYPPTGRRKEDIIEAPYIHLEADPTKQESLTSTNEIDPLEGEQTWPTREEEREAEMAAACNTKQTTRRVPKGTSSYQAAWIVDSDDDDEYDDEDEEDDDTKYPSSVDTASQQDQEEEEEEEEYETVSVSDADGIGYDEKMDYSDEMEAWQKIKDAREDQHFPDEVDTPTDTPARIRFQKFRGLQSFRTSAWHPDEGLPVDYARIFQFQDFNRSRRRIVKESRDDGDCAMTGWYVSLHISDVPTHLYRQHTSSQSPLVVFGMLAHEQKMSVVNMTFKSHSLGHYRPIKAKERLIVHMGCRRFVCRPVFSEHTNGNKHKFARYFHPKGTVVATTYAPITFPPASVLVFKERPDGVQDLVATGSLLSVDPKRIVVKRVVLSGHPFKVNRKTAVVRYMFNNRHDVLWFKPVQLTTKWGRRGHIKEPLGTHGHMKCTFDGQLKSQDTVLLNLYKRVYPKWTFDPHVSRPPPLYTYTTHNTYTCLDEHEGNESEKPPAKKRPKLAVTFYGD